MATFRVICRWFAIIVFSLFFFGHWYMSNHPAYTDINGVYHSEKEVRAAQKKHDREMRAYVDQELRIKGYK